MKNFTTPTSEQQYIKQCVMKNIFPKEYSRMWSLNIPERKKNLKFIAGEREKMLMEKAFREYFSPASQYFTIHSTYKRNSDDFINFRPSFYSCLGDNFIQKLNEVVLVLKMKILRGSFGSI